MSGFVCSLSGFSALTQPAISTAHGRQRLLPSPSNFPDKIPKLKTLKNRVGYVIFSMFADRTIV
jgi:hypothetical protein